MAKQVKFSEVWADVKKVKDHLPKMPTVNKENVIGKVGGRTFSFRRKVRKQFRWNI